VVVFLHGYAGNFAYECATVARAASAAGYATVCPSTAFDGRWWQPQGEQTARVVISWAKARYRAGRVVLAGLSNGGLGASRLAPRLAGELSGLVLISGVADDARAAGVPTLVVHGDRDGMCPPGPAREYARRVGARLAMMRGTHFLLLEDEPGVRAQIAAFLRRVW
jgi:pimeloyl-ACP methyl ester carboxylesterase